jgi:hypothetical protein
MRCRFSLTLLLASCIVSLGAAPPTAAAQTISAAAQAKAAAVLAQFPDGCQGLGDAVAAAVEADPSLAFAFVAAAATATPCQQQAIGAGLAVALTFFANIAAGTGPDADAARNAERLIQVALLTAPVTTLTAFSDAGGFTILATTLGGGSASSTTNSCISPSGPGATCR